MTTKKVTHDTADAAPVASSKDIALIHGVTPDGQGLQIVRARENRLELGAIRPLREGCAILGEVVKLKPREACPLVCDVEVQLEAPAPQHDRQLPAARARTGPAQVATDDYRKNWDAIWSRASKPTLAN